MEYRYIDILPGLIYLYQPVGDLWVNYLLQAVCCRGGDDGRDQTVATDRANYVLEMAGYIISLTARVKASKIELFSEVINAHS
jgi:hypothetical protein